MDHEERVLFAVALPPPRPGLMVLAPNYSGKRPISLAAEVPLSQPGAVSYYFNPRKLCTSGTYGTAPVRGAFRYVSATEVNHGQPRQDVDLDRWRRCCRD